MGEAIREKGRVKRAEKFHPTDSGWRYAALDLFRRRFIDCLRTHEIPQ